MPKRYSAKDLEKGFLVKDVATDSLGILVNRRNLMDDFPNQEKIWIWEIFWTGPEIDPGNNMNSFVELAMIGLLNNGTWVLETSKEP
jgi:hypothetical protein